MKIDNWHKMGKTDMLTLIYEQEKKIKRLTKEVEDLKSQLEDRTIKIKEAGSIAEASLKINKIFEVAQQAADEYLKSIKKVNKNIDNVRNKKIYRYRAKNVGKKYRKINSSKNSKELVLVNNGIMKITPKFFIRVLILFLSLIKKTLYNLEIKAKKARTFISNVKNHIKNYFMKLKNNIVKIFKYIKRVYDTIIINVKKWKNKYSFTVLKLKFRNKINCREIKKQKHESMVKNMEISIQEIEAELKRRKEKKKRIRFIKTVTYSAMIIIAFAIITSTSFFKILQVSGNSMEPNLHEGEILLTSNFFDFKKGDMIAFYYNDNVLIKRVIALEEDVVNIEDDGTVFVNSVKLEENYVKKLAYGNCDITFPYQVPKNSVFILGDNREVSIDSRSKSIGCISADRVIGKIQVKLNPFVIY